MLLSRLVLVLIPAFLAAGQEPRPAYEVASIKPNNSGDGHTGTDGYEGRVIFTNMPLVRLIADAYSVAPFQVSGSDWLAGEHFDITAKYPDGATPKDRARMLRTLLEDRFRLSVHREPKELSGYALVAAKGGFKLKAVGGDGDDSTHHTGGPVESLDAKRTSMKTLAALLSRYIGQPVSDQTSIAGAFDFQLRWSREDRVEAERRDSRDAPPSIFTALQESLGLRLQPQKVTVEMVMVDRVERAPTEN